MSAHWAADAVAQCVMCYRTAAAQQAERVRVLDSGILILLIPPILVLGLILGMAFRKNRAVGKAAEWEATASSACGLGSPTP